MNFFSSLSALLKIFYALLANSSRSFFDSSIDNFFDDDFWEWVLVMLCVATLSSISRIF